MTLLLLIPGTLLAYAIWVGLVFMNVGIDMLTWDHRRNQPRFAWR